MLGRGRGQEAKGAGSDARLWCDEQTTLRSEERRVGLALLPSYKAVLHWPSIEDPRLLKMLSKVVFFVGLAVTVLAVPVWLEVDFGLDTNGYQLPLSDSDDVAAPDQGFCGPFEQGTYNITVIEERPGHKQHVTAPKANAWLNEGPAHKNGHVRKACSCYVPCLALTDLRAHVCQWKIIPQENAAYAIENVGLSRGQREPFFAELKKAEGLAPPPPHPHHRWAVKAAHRAPQGPTHWRIQKAERGGCTVSQGDLFAFLKLCSESDVLLQIHHATEPCVWGPVKHFAEGGHHVRSSSFTRFDLSLNELVPFGATDRLQARISPRRRSEVPHHSGP